MCLDSNRRQVLVVGPALVLEESCYRCSVVVVLCPSGKTTQTRKSYFGGGGWLVSSLLARFGGAPVDETDTEKHLRGYFGSCGCAKAWAI